MEFGKLTEAALSKVDFTIPTEPEANKLILSGQKVLAAKLYIGCTRWGSKDWIGKLYPKGTKEIDFLKQYVKHYNSIELNATHYKIYGAAAITKWAAHAKVRLASTIRRSAGRSTGGNAANAVLKELSQAFGLKGGGREMSTMDV